MRDIVPVRPSAAGHQIAGRAAYVSGTPRLSVIIATHGRPDTLLRTLESLTAQSLPPDQFEVLVVVNGPRGNVADEVTGFLEGHPDLRVRILESSRAGVAHARALGAEAARGDFITMIDDDDWVSDTYLQRMVDGVRPGVIPLADIANVDESEGAEPDFTNRYSTIFGEHRGTVVPAAQLPEAVSVNVCKLVPTSSARWAGFDARLRSASDTLFWLNVLARTQFRFDVMPSTDAVYYRTVGMGTLSRQNLSYDFSVQRRLDAYRALAEVDDASPEVRRCLTRTARSLAMHVNRYLREHREEQDEVAQAVREQDVPVDWLGINLLRGTELLLVDEFCASAVPAPVERLLLDRAEIVDVLTTGVPPEERVTSVVELLAPYVGSVASPPRQDRSTDAWAQLLGQTQSALAMTEYRFEMRETAYGQVRSVSRLGGEHLTAAAYRMRHPDTTWIAMLSAPQSVDLLPGALPPHVRDHAVVGAIESELATRGLAPSGGVSGTEWIRQVACALADQVVFPDREAMEQTLAGCPPDLARRLLAHAVVVPPTPVPRLLPA